MTSVTCGFCGSEFMLGRDAQHNRSKWHKVARMARSYRKRGLSYAEIGRQFGLTRFYVLRRLRAEGL